MAETKKIKVKKKKRKLKVKRVLICLLVIILIILLFIFIKNLPIRNIYIVGNNILSDKEIMELGGISDYPSFVTTSKRKVESKLEKNDYVKEVAVKKNFFNKVYINIKENKILATYNDKLILENGDVIDNTYNLSSIPILTNDVGGIIEKFTKKFALIDDDMLLKISEITYSPNEVDNERFILKMNDGNIVYITLNKITKINKYNSIYSKMEGKKGIIYLDSGDYIEVKEN